MGLFDKIREPVFLKNDSAAKEQLIALETLQASLPDSARQEVNQEIHRVNAGIYGENAVCYELESSHIPMFVLHDLYLEYNGQTAQIDYLIITRKHQFVVECKNLYGNIEINNAGDFIRTVPAGRGYKKEGIYSPITQNRRHLELIKQIRLAEKTNFLSKALFEKYFYENYRSVVVLANPKTVLNAKFAKKEVKGQVIRADQLAEYIRRIDADPKAEASSEKDIEELAHFFLSIHKPCEVDYTSKFKAKPEEAQKLNSEQLQPQTDPMADEGKILCPKCGAVMVKRRATKGANAGNEFYGCSRYPACRGIVEIGRKR
ncbi:MAG: NERD domain-containing protein [Pygmaiobacter sp.]